MTPEHNYSLEVSKYASLPPDKRKSALAWAREAAYGHPDPATREVNRNLARLFEAKEIELSGAERMLAIDERRLAIKKELAANPLPLPTFRQAAAWTAKATAISGSVYIAAEMFLGAGAAARAWWAANGGWLIGGGCLLALLVIPISALFNQKADRTKTDIQPSQASSGAGEAGGGKTIIQQFFINGDGNTVVNNGEMK